MAEEALRDSEQRYRDLFEKNPHSMLVYDIDGLGFLAVNDAVLHEYGYSRDEFVSMTLSDIRLLARRPSMRVILMSGYGAGLEASADTNYRFLAKPFGRDDLMAAVATALAEGETARS